MTACWSSHHSTLGRMIDGRLTLRLARVALYFTMAKSPRCVMSDAHQVLGAMGLCEEHDLTVLNHQLQPIITRPSVANRVLGLLAKRDREVKLRQSVPDFPS